MIDINLLRVEKGGVPDIIRKCQENRGKDANLVDIVLCLDDEWKKQRFMTDKLNRRLNEVESSLKKFIQSGYKDTEEWFALLAEKERIEQSKKLHIENTNRLNEELQNELSKIGNLLADDVVVSTDENDNPVLRTWVPKNAELGNDETRTL